MFVMNCPGSATPAAITLPPRSENPYVPRASAVPALTDTTRYRARSTPSAPSANDSREIRIVRPPGALTIRFWADRLDVVISAPGSLKASSRSQDVVVRATVRNPWTDGAANQNHQLPTKASPLGWP